MNKIFDLNILFKYAIFFIFILLGIFVGLFRQHTSNFGWNGAISLETLSLTTHADLFLNTLIPVFRPFLHIEKELAISCGRSCVETFNAVVWCLAFLAFIFILFKNAEHVFLLKNIFNKLAVCSICFGFAIYSIFFSYGTFVDISYALSTTGLVLIFLNGKNKTYDKTYLTITLVLVLTFVANNSRPFFLYIFPIWVLISLFQKKYAHTAALIIGGLASAPYHITQFANNGSVTLSNYSGCNFAEVFMSPNKALIATSLPANGNSIEYSKYCAMHSKDILRYILDSPINAISDVFEMRRLLKIVAPPPFTPYNLEAQNQLWRKCLWVVLIITLYVPLLIISIKAISRLIYRKSIDQMLIYLAISMPLIFSVIAHSGWESGRVAMAFYYPLIILSFKMLADTNFGGFQYYRTAGKY